MAASEELRAHLAQCREKFAGTGQRDDPQAWRRELTPSRVGGWDLPERVGGLDFSCAQMLLLFALVGESSVDLRDVPGAGHARIMALPKTRRFDAALKDVVQGRRYCAIAITEEEAGSDLHGLGTVATPTGVSYVINGTKCFVSRLEQATDAIVFASVPRADGPSALTVFLVPLSSQNLAIEPLQAAGLRGASWGRLLLTDVVVPASHRIGGEGEGFSLFRKHFTYWRLAMASVATGACKATLEEIRTYLLTRNAYGGKLGRLTHLQQELAQFLHKHVVNSLLLRRAAEEKPGSAKQYVMSAMAKAEILEYAVQLHLWAQQTMGARAYQVGQPVEKRLRDLTGLAIADGPTGTLRAQVARAFVGDELYDLGLGRRVGAIRRDYSSLVSFWE
jgi:alkylation response protein AidB-like acyl-CoA dehydrogenase